MKFSEKEEEMLLDLFKIYSPSRNNTKMIEFIENFLKEIDVPYIKDENGNIFSLVNKEYPILSAHMDSVGDSDCGFMNDFINIFDYRGDRILKGMGNIGGDDKCGIFLILLKLIDDKKFNFIFSIDEEIGCIGINQVVPKNPITDFPYALVLDRRGFGDIICLQNSYGNKEFEDALAAVGKGYDYVPTRGLSSDAGTISKYINCANLSVAYHNPHSKQEFVSLTELYNTLMYLNKIVEDFKGKVFVNPVPYTPALVPAWQKGRATDYNDGYDDGYGYNYNYPAVGGKKTTYHAYDKTFWCPSCYKMVDIKQKLVIDKDTLYPDTRGFICKTCAEKVRKALT